MTAIDKVLNIARNEIGYHEVGNSITKYADEIDRTAFNNGPKNGYAWCAVFQEWLFFKAFGERMAMKMLNIPNGSSAAGCEFFMQYFIGAGAFHRSVPKPGDIVFFYVSGGVNHVGIVEKVEEACVYTIEGNSGDSVRRNSYMISETSIAGYGTPNYALVDGETGDEDDEEEPAVENVISTLKPRRVMNGIYPLLTAEYSGERREDTEALQQLLCLRGFQVEITGKYDTATYNAVLFAQQVYGIEEDGECGSDTWRCLISNGRY